MTRRRLSPAGLLPTAALVLVWLPLAARWSVAWSVSPDQAYGWAVPVLALYLLRERWRTLPAPELLKASGRTGAWWIMAAGLALLAAALPVLEANALWPAAQWSGAAAALAITLAAAALTGGSRWARHLAFPLCFVVTGLTWPSPVSRWVITTLAGINAQVAAEIVSAAGYPALVSGNVIAVANGLVGIDEACSGLRSLQAVGMIGCFFGEFFMLNWPRRIGLLAAAMAVALAGNLGRTSFLTWQVAARGVAAGVRWHDPAGVYELVVTLAATTALAFAFARPGRGPAAGAPPDRAPRPPASAGAWPRIVLCCAAAALLGTHAWYLAHEMRAPARVTWRLREPDSAWQPMAVPPQAQAVLGNTGAAGLAWRDPATGTRAWAFLISWQGDAAHGENPEWHDPTVCLPAAGGRLVRNLGTIDLRIAGQPLTFSAYRFAIAGRTIDTFFCHWDAELDKSLSGASPRGGIRTRRLERVMEGRRKGDVAHLTMEIESEDDADAVAWFRLWGPQVLRPTPLRQG